MRERLKKYDSYDGARSTRKFVRMPAQRRLSRRVSISADSEPAPLSLTAEVLALEAVSESFFNGEKDGESRTVYAEIPVSRSAGRKIFYTLIGAALLGVVLLGSVGAIYYRDEPKPPDVLSASVGNVDEQGVEQGSGDQPAEEKPGNEALLNYRVPADNPRFIRIRAQNVFSRIKELGLATDGRIDAPWNIHDVGWYGDSRAPGSDGGISLLVGHVSGRTMSGAFERIEWLESGQVIEIEMGSGKVIKYGVEKVESYTANSVDMDKVLYGVEPGKHSLRLLAVQNEANGLAGSDLPRFVVYAYEIK